MRTKSATCVPARLRQYISGGSSPFASSLGRAAMLVPSARSRLGRATWRRCRRALSFGAGGEAKSLLVRDTVSVVVGSAVAGLVAPEPPMEAGR
jgi:hypothetical protein